MSKLIYDTFSSNEDLLAKLQAGATGYDVIVPSDYMVTIMRQLDMLKELDKANLAQPGQSRCAFHRSPVRSGPGLFGAISVGYDWHRLQFRSALGEVPDSWDYIFDPGASRPIMTAECPILNDQREVIGAALKYLGYSMNSVDEAELEEAKQAILAIKPYIATFDSDSFGELLVSGEVEYRPRLERRLLPGHLAADNEKFGYVIPKEGGVIWTDNMAVPKTAPHPYTAEVFINYILDPEIGAQLTNWNYYGSPNAAAFDMIVDEIREDPGIYPSEETLAKMEFLGDLGEGTLLWDRIWTEIKSE